MKKKYIRPESRLFAINLDENIAESQTGNETGTTEGAFHVSYTKYPDGTGYFHNENYPFDTNATGGSVADALTLFMDTNPDWYLMFRDCLQW